MNIFEDENHLVNRLFYVVPDTSSRRLICFFYFAENLFTKDERGDLTLIAKIAIPAPSARSFSTTLPEF